MAVYTKAAPGKTGTTKAPSEGAFDCLRLLAASAVLFSHCYPLLGREADEPVARAAEGLTIGTLAVYAFFAISGYLVTQSWLRDPSVSRFMLRRSLRIFPALIFVIVASFAVLGPLVTDLPVGEYLARRDAWSYLAKILLYPTQYGLPGVFDNNPLPNVVNGSLWTLRLEFGLYIVVAGLGVIGILRFRLAGIAMLLACLTGYVAASQSVSLKNLSAYRQILDFFANAAPFFVGMALAQNDIDSKRTLFAACIIVVALGVVLSVAGAFTAVLLLSLPCLVLLAAHNMQCHLGRFGDYSYGVYLWGFPVAQTFAHFDPALTVPELLLRAGIVTFLLAVISWHGIEKRALRFKPRRSAT